MLDPTEKLRKKSVEIINSEIKSNDEELERKRLESKYGKIWNTNELGEDFTVNGFLAPYVSVKRKSDGKKGSLEFQHYPRFYFNFQEA